MIGFAGSGVDAAADHSAADCAMQQEALRPT